MTFARIKLHSTLDSVGDLGFGFWFWLFFGGQTERGGVGIRDLGLGLGIGDWAESFQPKPSQVRGTGDVASGVVTVRRSVYQPWKSAFGFWDWYLSFDFSQMKSVGRSFLSVRGMKAAVIGTF